MRDNILQEILQIEDLTDEEYRRALREIQIKYENLMNLSVRREIKKAKQGKASSQTRLGEFYEEKGTTHTDYMEAARWYSFAARQGSYQAKLALGRLLDSEKLTGDGSTKVRGLKYFLELAEEGYPTAQNIVGMKYYFGDGLEKNTAKGVQWLKKAAAQGSLEAQQQLGAIYANYNGEESKRWLQTAKETRNRNR